MKIKYDYINDFLGNSLENNLGKIFNNKKANNINSANLYKTLNDNAMQYKFNKSKKTVIENKADDYNSIENIKKPPKKYKYVEYDLNKKIEFPLFSIIIPIYNSQDYLQQCLDSVLNQNLNKWECILIDDGSTDNSGKICDEYVNKDSRFKVVHTENRGVSAARNTGIKLSQGEWICFVDSDDMIHPNKLGLSYRAALANNSEYVQHAIRVNNKTIWSKIKDVFCPQDLLVFSNKNYSISCIHDKLYKASLIKDNNILFDENVNFTEDTFFNIHCFFVAQKITCIDIPLYSYNWKRANSLSTTANKLSAERRLQIIKGFKRLLDTIKQYPAYKQNEFILKNYMERFCLKQKTESKIDLVFPYVNNNDPVWRAEFNKYTDTEINENKQETSARFRANEEMLLYKFRTIEKYMPWIDIVHFIVSSESQIPEWLDRTKVNIVYHSEIIPENKLPVFNSTAIEMYINNIFGLTDKFIYSNDDVYPNNVINPSDFFQNNNVILNLSLQPKKLDDDPDNVWKDIAYNSCILAYNNATSNVMYNKRKINLNKFIYTTKHLDTPMFRWLNLFVYNKYKNIINNSVTRFRDQNNFNQYLWPFYAFFHNRGISKQTITGYSQEIISRSLDNILAQLDPENKNRIKEICLNDTKNMDMSCYNTVLNEFKKIYPEKSKYEI